MIIWIASYPKSGNTWVRALLSYYFFSKEKRFNFDILKHIPNFNIGDFVNEKTKFPSNLDYADKALKTQKFICEKFKMNTFLKTHSSLIKIKKDYFTDKSVSLGCIYVVRDPRNVITSYKNFENFGYQKMLKIMMDENSFLHSNKTTQRKLKIKGMEIISSWSQNYNSWVNNNLGIPICLVKYEDLIKNTLAELQKIFEFIKKLNSENKTRFDLDRGKTTVLETGFNNLKKLEQKVGFSEKDEKDRTHAFFNQGKLNDWNSILPNEIKESIENKFYKEMKELGYL